MTFPLSARNYLIKALSGTPVVLDQLLKGRTVNDPIWDLRPDPVRFTLRELLAHLADWEPIWLERFVRMRDESRPFLPSVDEGQLAISNGYGQLDPLQSLARFKSGREAVVKMLDGLTIADWDRTGERESVGPLTLQMMASYVLSHDGYHMLQVVEWLNLAEVSGV